MMVTWVIATAAAAAAPANAAASAPHSTANALIVVLLEIAGRWRPGFRAYHLSRDALEGRSLWALQYGCLFRPTQRGDAGRSSRSMVLTSPGTWAGGSLSPCRC